MQVIFNGSEDNLKTWENAPKTFMGKKKLSTGFYRRKNTIKSMFKKYISKIFL